MYVSSLLGLFSSDLAIDLGTANTLVYVRGRGIAVVEPSIVAVNRITNRVEAVGAKAKEMLGVTATWMKDRLPDDVADQIGSMLSGAGDIAGSATEAASGAAAAATGKAGDLWNTARDKVSGIVQDDDQ